MPFYSSETKFKLLEDELKVGIWTWDLETSKLLWSDGVYRILGVDPHSTVPTIDFYQSLIHPKDQIDFGDAIGLVSERLLQDRRFRVIRADGSLRWLRSKAQPHFDRDGKTVMMVGVVMDVTEEEIVRTGLHFHREYSRVLSILTGQRTWRTHPDGKLIETAEWTRLTGQTPAEAHDWDELGAIHPADRTIFRRSWSEAISGGNRYSGTFRIRMRDGSFVKIANEALAQRGPDGEISQWVGHSWIVETQHVEALTVGGAPTAAMIRAARAYLNWTALDLASNARVSFSTVRRIEQGDRAVKIESIQKIQQAFEQFGVKFSVKADGAANISFVI